MEHLEIVKAGATHPYVSVRRDIYSRATRGSEKIYDDPALSLFDWS